MAPVGTSELSPMMDAPEDTSQETSQKIQDEAMHVRQLQDWWCAGYGPANVARNPILAAIDSGVLSELVHAGGGYHTILTTDRLDGLHRRLGNGMEAALEPLRKALQTRGGGKAQARVVGMLLFKEARNLHLQCEDGSAPPVQRPPSPAAATTTPAPAPAVSEEIKLDESWPSPRLYICADTYPEGAQMALRVGPHPKAQLLATLPAGTEYYGTGIVGDFLQVRVTKDGESILAYALHRMGDLVLLVPAQPAPTAAPAQAQAVQLDEAFSPARRFICSDSYPEGAQMAVKVGPNRESKQVATLPAGHEYEATGRVGDYLQIRLEINGEMAIAYVTHTIGDLLLLVPAEPEPPAVSPSAPAARAAAAAVAAAEAATAAAAAEAANGSRVVALEAKVASQEQQIQALQAEMAQMRAQLSAVAAAFRPLSM